MLECITLLTSWRGSICSSSSELGCSQVNDPCDVLTSKSRLTTLETKKNQVSKCHIGVKQRFQALTREIDHVPRKNCTLKKQKLCPPELGSTLRNPFKITPNYILDDWLLKDCWMYFKWPVWGTSVLPFRKKPPSMVSSDVGMASLAFNE
jgi:hypothetical protein